MTTTPATQALLPVTQSDRDAAASAVVEAIDQTLDIRLGEVDHLAVVQAFARQRDNATILGNAREDIDYWNDVANRLGHESVCEALEALDALQSAKPLPGDVGTERLSQIIAKARDDWHDGPLGSMPDYIAGQIIAALTPSALSDLQRLGQEFDAATITPSVEMPFVEGGPLLDDGMCDDHGAFGCKECLAAFAAKHATPSALSGDAGEALDDLLAKSSAMQIGPSNEGHRIAIYFEDYNEAGKLFAILSDRAALATEAE